ncbi:DUF6778 family protein [Acidimangrovimonas sediminis]|uniref:DUF6778 family protein n=1 Tax=Acidimangrovimonas sediminis TaxID=2056283 RepID=UPI000C8016F9|nr:DUF6778 family protein [Acidimangrovimonas sediminis]
MIARRTLLVLLGATALGACATRFATSYPSAVPPSESRNWHLARVDVAVPPNLTVSDANTLVPDADIVWHGDGPGDRRAQVAAILRTAVAAGARGLPGRQPVVIEVFLQRFHALTPRAEALSMQNVGVLNVDFTIAVVDARSGKVLVPPTPIQAALPGLTGKAAEEASARGQTQKTEIIAHVRAVVAGWLGVGPDARNSFTRIGA